MPERIKGKVKWFNNTKGYGFITPDEGNEDVFFHFSAISGSGFKTIKDGQAVEFHTIQGDKGLQAADVEAI